MEESLRNSGVTFIVSTMLGNSVSEMLCLCDFEINLIRIDKGIQHKSTNSVIELFDLFYLMCIFQSEFRVN